MNDMSRNEKYIEKGSTFFFAKSEQELFNQKNRISGLEVVGGCTYLKHLPEKAISTSLIPTLKQITKHERYIEAGPGVTLAELEELGEKHLPKVLYDAVTKIANPFVRNIATIGGNLCAKEQRLGLFAPLLALDSKIEVKSPSESKFISLQNFTGIPEGKIFKTLRIPLNDWDVSIYVKLGPDRIITENSAGFAFLASSEKNAILNLRIAFAGPFSFRSSSLENRLLGRRLPLNYNEISSYVQEASIIFDKEAGEKKYEPILKSQFLNLVRYSLEQLT